MCVSYTSAMLGNAFKVERDQFEQQQSLQDSLKLYRAILEHNPNSQFALRNLGKIAVRQENWGDVKEYFNRILETDPQERDALYYLAIAHRESGKFKALLLRKLDWDKSKKFFESLLSQDSTYRDVFLQYARLQRYKGNYREAILLGHRQISLKPDLVEPQIYIFRLYRYLISHLDFSEARQWLEKLEKSHAQYAIGELFRRQSTFDSADSVFRKLLLQSKEMPIQPVNLSLCRIFAEKNLPQKVDSCFWQAVKEINSRTAADLILQDIKYLLTTGELETYYQTTSDSGQIRFFHRFWQKRNPLPASSWNRRLVEHYIRLNYADKYFEYDGFRTWFADPDPLGYLEYPLVRKLNNEYNDKGIIYIRHGFPNERIRTTGYNVEFNESWLYYANPPFPEMTFHFITGKSGSDWRFAPILSDPAMLQDRLTWGKVYYSLLTAGPLEKIQYEEAMANISKASVTEGLSSDRHTWPGGIETFDFPISIETFRADSGQSRMDIAYAIPAISEISSKLDVSEDSIMHIENGLAILTRNNRELFNYNETEFRENSETDRIIKSFSLYFAPDSYIVGIHINPLDQNILAGYKFLFGIPDYSEDYLLMSDIQLARHISPSSDSLSLHKNGLNIWPNPAHRFKRDSVIFIYFEIYNLTQDDRDISQYSIEYNLSHADPNKRGITNLFGLFASSDRSSISIRNEHQVKSDFSAEYLALDVSEMQIGRYNLEITVTDDLSAIMTMKRVELILK